MKITGTFEVNMQPLDFSGPSQHGAQLGRMSLSKTFYGDLSATSQGEMLSAMTSVQGSAGYVAIEQTTGSLNGKQGSFILQHFGIMAGTESKLVLEVVPDSGTDELKGISGTMNITRKDGKHYYDFEYNLNH